MKRLVLMGLFTGMILFIASLGISFFSVYNSLRDISNAVVIDTPSGGSKSLDKIAPFRSSDDFRDYIQEGENLTYGSSSKGGVGSFAPTGDMGVSEREETNSSSASPDRYSTTNVQVRGIDEPDIVKTDGESIFFSREDYWIMDMVREDVGLSESVSTDSYLPNYQSGTSVFDAYPPEDLNKISTIDMNGELLISNTSLLVLNYNTVHAFNISNSSAPSPLWSFDVSDNTSILSSRLFDNALYMITQQYTDYTTPCPIEPLVREGSPVVTIRCLDIYHPTAIVESDTTYTVFKIEPATGKILNSTSFIGSAESSVVYMSPNSIYLTYTYQGNYTSIMIDFFLMNDDLISPEVTSKLTKLKTYDISAEAKYVELTSIIDKYQQGLDTDDRTRVETELQNRMTAYYKEHSREFILTGIVKIDQETLEYEAIGAVPGYPLNQFALDEYNTNLRIATTIGSNWWLGFGNSQETTNDVYVLDSEMRTIGSVIDLGLSESIYSVRFIGNAGYIVTFLQTDPFYVLDLSNPRAPEVEGELKIPGYSSYLHPISKTIVLGVGQEDGKVKLSLFDVSNPQFPQEVSKYTLDEYWTEVSTNHHAFMIDTEHSVFFLPGSNSGYVFSYAGDQLSLTKAVGEVQARRALYIDNYLYVIGDNEIVILDENNWERVKDLQLSNTN